MGNERHLGGLGGAVKADSRLAAELSAARSSDNVRQARPSASSVMSETNGVRMHAASPAVAEKFLIEAAQKEFQAAVKSGNAGKAGEALKNQSPRVILTEVHKMDSKQLATLVEGVRSGAIKDRNVAMAVNVEQLSRTKWGASHPAQVDNLRQKYMAGKVSYVADADGAGKVNPWAMTDKHGDIRLDQKLMNHPEAAAATLANESVHSEKTTRAVAAGEDPNERGDYLKEETDSSVADAQVWGELRDQAKDKSFAGASESEATYQLYKRGGEAAVGAETASNYVAGYLKAGDPDRIRDVLNDLAQHPEYQRALSSTQATTLGQAAGAVAEYATTEAGGKNSASGIVVSMMEVARLGVALRHAPKDVAAAALKMAAARMKVPESQIRGAFYPAK